MTVLGSAPLATATASAVLPTPPVVGTVTLLSPPVGAGVPTLTPTFVVSVTTAADDARVEVRYWGDEDYDTETWEPIYHQLSTPVLGGLEDLHVSLPVTEPMTDATRYHWDARLVSGAAATEWVSGSFATKTLDGRAYAPGAWTIDAGARAMPHAWFLTPDTGNEAGEQAGVVGTGFGPAGTVFVGDTPAVVLERTSSPAADGAAPLIDAATGEVTVAHQTITFTMPALDDDSVGDVVTVENGG